MASLKVTRAPTSVRSAVRALKVYARWTVTEGYLRTDPLASVQLPRAPRPLIQPMSGSQVAALMSVGSPVLRVAVAILADTGLRASELCGLTVNDVHEDYLFVSGKGGHERLAPYGEACRSELHRYVSKSRGLPASGEEPLLVTGTRIALTSHRLGELMREAGREAGIRGVRVSPHTLRHTFAIEFLRNGGGELALQKALGHRSLDMVKIYAELTQVDLADVHRAASPLDAWRITGAKGQPKGRRPILCSSRSRGERRSW
jgi:site-specific recombinase XerD